MVDWAQKDRGESDQAKGVFAPVSDSVGLGDLSGAPEEIREWAEQHPDLADQAMPALYRRDPNYRLQRKEIPPKEEPPKTVP
jgi:hypothetical protein